MIKIILTFLLYLVSIIAFSQNENNEKLNTRSCTITVSVTNALNDNGKVYFALHTQKTFLKVALKNLNSTIINGIATVKFENVSKGNYSITCYHDSNDNGKMDFKASGMPAEDYGATNNAINFGPPQFNASKFEVSDKNLTFKIKF